MFSPQLKKGIAYGKMLNANPKDKYAISSHLILTSAYVVGLLVLTFVNFLVFIYHIGSATYWTWSLLFGFQLSRRFYECLYVHKFSEKWGMLIQLPAAWWFYIQVIFSMSSSLLSDPPQELSLPLLFISLLLFFLGSFLQHDSHLILAASRSGDSTKNEYVIPTGGLFKYLSTPHYFAEILIYSGLTALVPSLIQSWLILFFVILNLGYTSHYTHKWYQSNFKSYPKSRKALIPFIF